MSSSDARPGDLGRVVRDAQRAIEGELLAGLVPAGFDALRPGHMLVFRHLDPEGMRIGELARDARVSRQAVSQVVRELEQLGLLVQDPDPIDGRATLVRYSERGMRGYALAEQVFADIERRCAAAVGKRSLATTRRVLATIADGLDEADGR